MALRGMTAGLAALGLATTPALAADGTLRVEHAAARVIVIPEARSDVVYTINPGRAGLPPVKPRQDGGVIVLDGGLGGGFGPFGPHIGPSCRGSGDQVRVSVPGRGDVAVQDLPVITARVPAHARVKVEGAVFGAVGPSQSLDFANAGCGDWRIAEVHGPLHLALAGSGDIRAQASAEAVVDISGSSDVYLGAVKGGLKAHLSGSGDVHAASINGPLAAGVVGSGDVIVDGGQASTLSASISGSGDVKFGGVASAVSASIAGSGDVDVARVNGPVSKHIAGSGAVNIAH